MGRKMQWPDKVIAPLPRGTLGRMAAVLRPGESKTDFLRSVVLAGLEIREALVSIPTVAAEPVAVPAIVVLVGEAEPEPAIIREPLEPSPSSRGRHKPKKPKLTREEAARKIVEGLPWPPRCQHDHCGIRADLVCLEACEAYCNDHRRYAADRFDLAVIGQGRR